MEDEILEFNYKNPNKITEYTGGPRFYGKDQGGFPSDDANALQQMASGEFDWMDGWYGSQFYQNETLEASPGGVDFGRKQFFYPTEHTPVMKGTLTGMVHYKEIAVQTFVFSSIGNCTSTKIGKPNCFVENMHIDWQIGRITSFWNKNVSRADIKLVVSYETER
jgi:hypothetical protein